MAGKVAALPHKVGKVARSAGWGAGRMERPKAVRATLRFRLIETGRLLT
jgi:hypothetical protein